MTHGFLICASKFKSVRNRPAVVRYREHCFVTLFSFIHNTQAVSILLLFLVLVGCVCDYDAQISFVETQTLVWLCVPVCSGWHCSSSSTEYTTMGLLPCSWSALDSIHWQPSLNFAVLLPPLRCVRPVSVGPNPRRLCRLCTHTRMWHDLWPVRTLHPGCGIEMQSKTRSPSRLFVRVVQQCAVTESHRHKASALSAEATECTQQPQAQAVFVQFLSDIVLIDWWIDWLEHFHGALLLTGGVVLQEE